jgi:membrane-associated phospholipid phosphatase
MIGINFSSSTTSSLVKSGSSTIAEIGRPVAATFQKQLPLVLSWAELRNERATEILAQIDAQYAFWSSIVYMHPDRTRRTFELINILLQFCVYVEMRMKHALACWRPVEYNAQVQPMITTPGHGSFPSGHSTQAHAVARVLKILLNLYATDTSGNAKYATVRAQLNRQAARIAINRTVAGVHFPVDSMAGRMLGVALADYFVGRCTGTSTTSVTMKTRTFKSTEFDKPAYSSLDFNPFSSGQNLDTGPFYGVGSTAWSIPPSPLLGAFWGAALQEWTGKFP